MHWWEWQATLPLNGTTNKQALWHAHLMKDKWLYRLTDKLCTRTHILNIQLILEITFNPSFIRPKVSQAVLKLKWQMKLIIKRIISSPKSTTHNISHLKKIGAVSLVTFASTVLMYVVYASSPNFQTLTLIKHSYTLNSDPDKHWNKYYDNRLYLNSWLKVKLLSRVQ